MKTELRWWGIVVSLMFLFACRPAIITPPSPLEPPSSGAPEPGPPPERPEAVKDELQQRERVAAALTAQGRQRLDAGQVDKAIRFFEQALSQSPHFGPGYYYLAESWLRKNNGSQARAFHDQAQLYLHEQPAWRARLERQQKEIERGISELAIP
jgi:tetratricopeptide (TPR) repeat protein